MPPKRLSAKDKLSRDDWQITDEWGIYDPAKAGMQALYARLGRPILSASPATSRRERRRGVRPERSGDGVGLAIEEARRRAGLALPRPENVIPQSPARAMRALKARPLEAPIVPVVDEPSVEAVAESAPPTIVPKRRARKSASAPASVAVAVALVPDSAVRTRTPARSRKPKTAKPAADAAATAPVPPACPVPPPVPSPRRPRGPVPLAAWAHAVNEAPPAAPAPTDRRGFWRGVFRIPAEVALVEYARGCRIERLLIEAAPEAVPDFI